MSLEEVLNPFLDKKGAIFGAAIMAATLITVLAINAASQGTHERPVFWVTLPAAFVMLIFDLTMGWLSRAETRKIAHEGRRRAETALAEREIRRKSITQEEADAITPQSDQQTDQNSDEKSHTLAEASSHILSGRTHEMIKLEPVSQEEKKLEPSKKPIPTTLASLVADTYRWAQETFPTTMTVFHHLPLALVPFAFCMCENWNPALSDQSLDQYEHTECERDQRQGKMVKNGHGSRERLLCPSICVCDERR